MTTSDNTGPELVSIVPQTDQKPVSDPDALYAALDLGTNSCRMLIAQPKGGQFHVIDSFSKTVQLGKGLEVSGKLSRSAMNRSVGALRVCAQKLKTHQVQNARLVATAACRRALNGRDFIRRVRRQTGLKLEVIAPEEEARLAVVSCAPLVSSASRQVLIVDIGGGSTELVWIDLSKVAPPDRARAIMRLRQGLGQSNTDTPFPKAEVVDWISIPLGVATLKDQYADVEDDAARFALMSWYFEEQMASFTPYQAGSDSEIAEDFQIIGTSGTITTVAATHLGLRRYDRNKVDGLRMTTAQIDAVIVEYLALGPDGRRNDPRIGRDRHVLIMSGAAILQTLMRIWPTNRLSVADRGLREGLLYDQMNAHGVLEDGLI